MIRILLGCRTFTVQLSDASISEVQCRATIDIKVEREVNHVLVNQIPSKTRTHSSKYARNMGTMRPIFLTAGSRGDTEPMYALCTALLRSPNVGLTSIVVSSDSMSLSPSIGESFKVYALQQSKGIEKDYLPAFQEDSNDTETHKPESEIDLLGCAIRDLIVPETKRIVSIAEESKCTIVITTFMTLSIAQVISQKLGIPLVFLQYQPVVPTRYYPHLTLSAKEAAVGTFALQKGDTTTYNSLDYLESHYQFIRNGFRACLDAMNVARAGYGLPPVTLTDMCDILEGKPENTHVIVATQSQLLPRSPDMGPDAILSVLWQHPISHPVGTLKKPNLTCVPSSRRAPLPL